MSKVQGRSWFERFVLISFSGGVCLFFLGNTILEQFRTDPQIRIEEATSAAVPFCGEPNGKTGYRSCHAFIEGEYDVGILFGVDRYGVYKVLLPGSFQWYDWRPWVKQTHLYMPNSPDGERIAIRFKQLPN